MIQPHVGAQVLPSGSAHSAVGKTWNSFLWQDWRETLLVLNALRLHHCFLPCPNHASTFPWLDGSKTQFSFPSSSCAQPQQISVYMQEPIFTLESRKKELEMCSGAGGWDCLQNQPPAAGKATSSSRARWGHGGTAGSAWGADCDAGAELPFNCGLSPEDI